MKFLVDQPLGGLAKWLRFCGFDADCRRLAPHGPGSLPPPDPGTFILTRQESLRQLARPDLSSSRPAPRGPTSGSAVPSKIAPRQLKPLSRCSRCNQRLRPIPREQAQGRVPEHVFHYHDQFFECGHCRRLFWPGSHLPAILKTLKTTR